MARRSPDRSNRALPSDGRLEDEFVRRHVDAREVLARPPQWLEVRQREP
jgi:hypothetical protein